MKQILNYIVVPTVPSNQRPIRAGPASGVVLEVRDDCSGHSALLKDRDIVVVMSVGRFKGNFIDNLTSWASIYFHQMKLTVLIQNVPVGYEYDMIVVWALLS